ncbi:MAG: hypothetical protein JJT78_13295 [Leptospira sp.]|nr:hypothetical protein [Leptospira sp.]
MCESGSNNSSSTFVRRRINNGKYEKEWLCHSKRKVVVLIAIATTPNSTGEAGVESPQLAHPNERAPMESFFTSLLEIPPSLFTGFSII